MACISKIGSLYELVTKNVVVTTTNTIFGINPRIWLSLPCEGLLLLKIRQVVPTTGETLPVQIAVPANSTVSTVGDDTCCPVTGVDYFPKVLDCDQKIVKAVLAYLEDPDAPEGTAFVRYLAVRCFVGDTIKWSDMI